MGKSIPMLQYTLFDEFTVWELKDNIVTLAVKDRKTRFAKAVVDGTLLYDEEKNAYKLIGKDERKLFIFYYRTTKMYKQESARYVKAGESILPISVIKIGAIKEIKGLQFWIESLIDTSSKINPLPYLSCTTMIDIEVPKKKKQTGNSVKSTVSHVNEVSEKSNSTKKKKRDKGDDKK